MRQAAVATLASSYLEEAVGGEVIRDRGSVGTDFALDSAQVRLDLPIRRATAILAQLLTADVKHCGRHHVFTDLVLLAGLATATGSAAAQI